MNCVHTDGSTFDLLSYQLNTTDFRSPEGVKDLAWFDSDLKLFNKIVPFRGMLRMTDYQDYDPEVFEKILAMLLYGMDLSYTWKDLEKKAEDLKKQEEESRQAVSSSWLGVYFCIKMDWLWINDYV